MKKFKAIIHISLVTILLLNIKYVNGASDDTNILLPKRVTSSQLTTKDPINKIIAIVNNGVITSQDLDKEITLLKNDPSFQNGYMNIDIKKKILNQLIEKKLSLQLAKREGIIVNKSEVDNAVNTIAQRNGLSLDQLKMQIRQTGVSLEAYKKKIKDSLIINQLQQKAVASRIYISPNEIKEYLNQHQNNIKEYYVQHILIPISNNKSNTKILIKKIVNELKENKIDFSSAAKRYSQSGDADLGGSLGWKTINQLPSIFANKVASAKEGSVIGPFIANGSYHILYLKDVKTQNKKQHFEKQYNISQIILKVTPLKTEEQVKAQLSRIDQSLENNIPFSQLAKENTQNRNNANQGGNMGWLALNKMNPTIAKVVLETPVGKHSKPFVTNQGWQIIKVNKVREENNTKEFERQQAMNAIFRTKAGQAVKAWMINIKRAAYIKIIDPEFTNNQ